MKFFGGVSSVIVEFLPFNNLNFDVFYPCSAITR